MPLDGLRSPSNEGLGGGDVGGRRPDSEERLPLGGPLASATSLQTHRFDAHGIAQACRKSPADIEYIRRMRLPKMLNLLLHRVMTNKPSTPERVWAQMRDVCSEQLFKSFVKDDDDLSPGSEMAAALELLSVRDQLREEKKDLLQAKADQAELENELRMLKSTIREESKKSESKHKNDYGNEPQKGGNKFSDGIAGAADPQYTAKLDFYPADYRPPNAEHDELGPCSSLGKWKSPKGILWGNAASVITDNCVVMLEKHSVGAPPGRVVPLYVYSISIYQKVYWAMWLDFTERYVLIPDTPLLEEYFARASKEKGVMLADWKMELPEEVQDFMEQQYIKDAEEADLAMGSPTGGGLGQTMRLPAGAGDLADQLLRGAPEIPTVADLKFVGREECGVDWFINSTSADEAKIREGPHHVVVRCLNAQSQLWPLKDNVGWFVAPKVAFGDGPFSFTRHATFSFGADFSNLEDGQEKKKRPPCMIYEYIQSRKSDEQLGGAKWTCKPSRGRSSRGLMEKCYAQKNQQEESKQLERELEMLIASVPKREGYMTQPQLQAIIDKKRAGSRSALSIRNALDIQLLDWEGERWFCAFSGRPLVIMTAGGDDEEPILSEQPGGLENPETLAQFWRMFDPFPDQPFWHLNAAMRNTQLRRTRCTVNIGTGKQPRGDAHLKPELQGTYLAADPESTRSGGLEFLTEGRTSTRMLCEAARTIFKFQGGEQGKHGRHDHHVWWEPDSESWVMARRTRGRPIKEIEVPAEMCTFDIGNWMMHQVRPLIYCIDKALKELRESQELRLVQKNYRGLANVNLPRAFYDVNKVVLWAQYSSSSRDQGVARSFASGGSASVFTILGRSCSDISPWSRFAREEEWLYPVNSMFRIDFMLTDEMKAILQKEGLQLYELSEVTEEDTHVFHIKALLSRAARAADAALIFQSELAVKGDKILDVSLKSVEAGKTDSKSWSYIVTVEYDGGACCPVRNTVGMQRINDEAHSQHGGISALRAAELIEAHWIRLDDQWRSYRLANDDSSERGNTGFSTASPSSPNNSSSLARSRRYSRSSRNMSLMMMSSKPEEVRRPNDKLTFSRAEDPFDADGDDDAAPVNEAVLALLGLDSGEPQHIPDTVTIYHSVEDGTVGDSSGITIRAQKLHERWAIKIQLRKTRPRDGFAVLDSGAKMMAEILKCRVPIERVIMHHNGVTADGATHLLEATRVNKHVVEVGLSELESATGQQFTGEQHNQMNDIRAAIQIRCLHNQCARNSVLVGFSLVKQIIKQVYTPSSSAVAVLEGDHEKVVTWPRLCSLALWDIPDLLIDFDGIVNSTFDLATGKQHPQGPAQLATFCEKLFKQRALAGVNYTTPSLALVALVRTGTPMQVSRLLDIGADPSVEGRYGQLPFFKALQREEYANATQDTPQGKLASQVLARLKSGTIGKPQKVMMLDHDKEHARLKAFSIQIMAKACAKQGDLLDELLASLKFPQDEDGCGFACPFESVRRVCSELEQKNSQIGGEKINPMLLLVRKLYTQSGADIDRTLSFEGCPQPWRTDADDQAYADYNKWLASKGVTRNERGTTVPNAINRTLRTLWDTTSPPQAVEEAWGGFQGWMKLWGLLNATLNNPINYRGRRHVLYRSHPLPPEVLAEERKRLRGDTFGWPANGSAQFVQPEIWNPKRSILYVIHGVSVGGDLASVSDYPDEGAVLLPALLLMVVDKVEVRPDGLTVMDVVSRGSLLATDPELNMWAASCVKQADAAHQRLAFTCPKGGPQRSRHYQPAVNMRQPSGSMIGAKFMSGASMMSLSRMRTAASVLDFSSMRQNTSFLEQSLMGGSVGSSDLGTMDWCCRKHHANWCHYRQQRLRGVIMNREDEEFDSIRYQYESVHFPGKDAKGLVACANCVYFSHDTSRQPLEQKQQLANSLYETFVEPVSPFMFTRIQKAGSDVFFTNFGVSSKKVFPHTKRLGSVLLHKLGRRYEGHSRDQLIPMVPRAVLDTHILHRTDDAVEIVIDAEAIDQAAVEMDQIGIKDPWFERLKTYPDFAYSDAEDGLGASAERIFGSGEFRISINEIKQLIANIKVFTTRDVPIKFYDEFTDRTSKADTMMFFNARRVLPLTKISKESEWKALAERCKIVREKAQERLATLRGYRDAMLEKRRSGDVEAEIGPPDRRRTVKIVDNLGDLDYDISVEEDLVKINDRVIEHHTKDLETSRIHAKHFKQWLDDVRGNYAKYGFDDDEHVEKTLGMAIVELSTGVCVVQPGYFFVSGTHGNANQLDSKSHQPITFLSAPGLDFGTAATTVLEGPKYFLQEESPEQPHKGFLGFKPGKELELRKRVKALYREIFRAASHFNVRNPSMLPMGLGVFLENVHRDARDSVKEAYFRAQFELLCEEDWGFQTYWLNCAQHHKFARAIFEEGLRPGGEYNNPAQRKKLSCEVVFHNRDCKFLARELAMKSMNAAFLNPSDATAVMQGLLGLFWETGRADAYVGEEDFAASSTAAVSCTLGCGFGGALLRLQCMDDSASGSCSLGTWADDGFRDSNSSPSKRGGYSVSS
eukprot:Hpha_TRINITY_DN10847_c0_g1::TRINITY_DN10847_c0_g1_i1::g.23078::m.23078